MIVSEEMIFERWNGRVGGTMELTDDLVAHRIYALLYYVMKSLILVSPATADSRWGHSTAT